MNSEYWREGERLERDRAEFSEFVGRAMILGCSGEDAGLWAQVAAQRGWEPADDLAEFDAVVLDYLVRLARGETWSQELRKLAERRDED